MKKLFCAALSTCIVLSSSFMVTYADSSKGKSGDSNGKPDSKSSTTVQTTETTDTTDTTTTTETQKPTVESLKQQLKEQHKDKTIRTELIKQIYDLKKQNKEESKMILVNGKEVSSDVPPVIKYGRTLIPVRAITNALGATVEWDEATKTATITKGTTVIEITLGSKIAIVNGKEVELGVPAETYNNRTIVPIRFIAETFKQSVDYDAGTGTVIIEDGTTGTGTTDDTTTTDPATGTGTDTTTGTGTGTDTTTNTGTTDTTTDDGTTTDTNTGTTTPPAN